MNAARVFFDTNILLYIYTDADPVKQKIARELYRDHALSGAILLSTQVIQEFYVAASRKLALPGPTVRALTEALFDLPLVIVTPAQIRAAIDYELRYRISFWDSLILAAAEAGGAEMVYSEDLNHTQEYGRVVVRNPFLAKPENPGDNF